MIVLPNPIEFLWDKANEKKNLQKHRVTAQETEEAFFDPNKKLFEDILHSGKEERYILLGKTKKDRLLFIAFTIRDNKIRAISARNLNKKEKPLYEEEA
jgi:uncharacterized protein